jgi:hypothetical protein
VAWYASEIGKYKEVEEIGTSASEAREATLGVEHLDILEA